jgi:hypothetical protein
LYGRLLYGRLLYGWLLYGQGLFHGDGLFGQVVMEDDPGPREMTPAGLPRGVVIGAEIWGVGAAAAMVASRERKVILEANIVCLNE